MSQLMQKAATAFAFMVHSITFLALALERFARRELLAIGVEKNNEQIQIIAAPKGLLARVIEKVTIALTEMNQKFRYLNYAAHNATTGQTLLIGDDGINNLTLSALAGAIGAYLLDKIGKGSQKVADIYLATPENFKGSAVLVDKDGKVLYAGNAFQHLRMLATNNTVVGIKNNAIWVREKDGNWKPLKQFGVEVIGMDRIHTDTNSKEWATVSFKDGTVERLAFKMDGNNISVMSMDETALAIADDLTERFVSTPATMVTGPNADYVAGVIYDGNGGNPTVTYFGAQMFQRSTVDALGLNMEPAPGTWQGGDPEDGDHHRAGTSATAS